MLKAIIVDNEEPAINVLKILLERTGCVQVMGAYLCAKDALSEVMDLKPDIAFLDIEMSEMNGLELAVGIQELTGYTEIVFVTACDQYAIHAFRVNALDYLLKPLSFEVVERSVIRFMKRKRLVPPPSLPLDNGRVCCFGKLSVYGPGSDRPVKWRTSKAEELFAYMIQNLETKVSKWKICEVLWPESSYDKIDGYLHTTIYKMKKDLSSAGISFLLHFSNSCYWMSLPNTYIDTIEFNSLTFPVSITASDSLEKSEKVFSLYRSGYLEENGYLWALPKIEEYADKFRELAEALANYYLRINDLAASERILKITLEKFPLDEHFHEMLLRLYLKRKNRAAFITHYNTMVSLLHSDLGIEPGNAIKALYQSLVGS